MPINRPNPHVNDIRLTPQTLAEFRVGYLSSDCKIVIQQHFTIAIAGKKSTTGSNRELAPHRTTPKTPILIIKLRIVGYPVAVDVERM
jgi:hypothetical protein